MALQMDWTTSHGVLIKDAYITIEMYKSKNFHKGAHIYILIYNSLEDKSKGFAEIRRLFIPVATQSYQENFADEVLVNENLTDTISAYNFVKALDGMQDNGLVTEVNGIDFTQSSNL